LENKIFEMDETIENFDSIIDSIDLNVLNLEELNYIDEFTETEDPQIENNSDYIGQPFDSIADIFHILFDEIGLKTLNSMNEIRIERIRERTREPMKTKKRKRDDDQYNKGRDKYTKAFSSPFTIQNLNDFIAVLLCASVNRKNQVRDHWSGINVNSTDGTIFIKSRMHFSFFKEMFACFTVDADDLQGLFNNKMKSVYTCSVLICLDESMVPFKGVLINPHHIVVPGKPHPNGIKIYTFADKNNFLFCTLICTRTPIEDEEMPIHHKVPFKFVREENTPKTIVDIINFGCSFLSEYHILIADTYFGNLSSLDALVKNGHDGVLQCMSNRPSNVFKYGLNSKEFENVPYNAAFFDHQITETQTKIYSAVTINTELINDTEEAPKKKLLNYISSLDNVDQITQSNVPILKKVYAEGSRLIDKANENIMNVYYSNKKRRWRTALLIWYLLAIINNARIIYNKVKNQKLSQLAFIKQLIVQLSPKQNDKHQVTNLKPNNGHCVYCRSVDGTRSSATYKCETCGFFHKECLDYHVEFALQNL
jgi:hypothetical protein